MHKFTIPKIAMKKILWCVEKAYRRGYQHGLLAAENGKRHNDKDVLCWRFSEDYKLREAPIDSREAFRSIKNSQSLESHFLRSPDGLGEFSIEENGSDYTMELR